MFSKCPAWRRFALVFLILVTLNHESVAALKHDIERTWLRISGSTLAAAALELKVFT